MLTSAAVTSGCQAAWCPRCPRRSGTTPRCSQLKVRVHECIVCIFDCTRALHHGVCDQNCVNGVSAELEAVTAPCSILAARDVQCNEPHT
eukprot:1158472-Pelagomonas_calceolata.AAC.9